VRDRHSLHFCGWLQERDAGFMGAGHEAALADIGREIENARAACHWAAAQGEAKRLIQAVGALGRFHYCRGAQPGHVLFEGLAATLAVAHDPASPSADVAQRAMARILTWESTFSGMLGHAERRAHLAEEARVLLDTPPLANQDTRLERAYLYWQFGFVHRETDPKTARTFFRRSRDLFLELGDRWGQAQALMGLGMAARNLGAHHEAEEAVTQALELCQAVGDDQGATGALALLGDIAMEQSDFARAERFVRQGLNLASEQSRGQIAYGLFKLGGILVRSGQFAEAKRPATESTSLFTDLGMRRMLIWSLLLSGQVHRHLADYQAARVLAEEALSLEHELGVQRGTGVALGLLGALALAEGAYPEARKLCDESIAGWQQSGAYPRRLEGELACAGLAARGLGQRGEASRDLLAQLKSAVEHHLFVPLLCALAGIALLLADEGEAEHAVELYALAQTYPFVANSRWFEDVAGHEIAAIAASLPPDAAQARGQAQDLWQTAADLLEELSGRLAAD
jgi:tetratricopeptide (TPR) repeat protein